MFKDVISNEPGFLAKAYSELDFRNGDLVEVKDIETLDEQAFINKAQWLNLCQYINRNKSFAAESIFFVENNPVIVFVNSIDTDKHKLHEIFNQIWCMANPRLLFISTPTELNVYDLANKPVRKEEELSPLETVKNTADIASVLKKYRRESIESGEVFGDERFGKVDSRADKALIEDIKTVRASLFQAGLDKYKLKYAHALIGRSIFIRYLEDRGILTKDYFYEIAENNPQWKKLLEKSSPKPGLHPEMGDLLYLEVLLDIEFTYKLYKKLAEDFNGDMFPTDPEEEKAVKAEHLWLLQKFLTGEQDQERLFFWAYKFDIIPIELISSIYEELYHFEDSTIPVQTEGTQGTHYTPPSLVEFVLSGVLTIDKLKTNPRIIDPACGSGIFLVEAFRRIVRYELFKAKNRKLSFQKLEDILRNQLRGIELNREAVRISAFSLYLAFLHYQDPPDILKQIKQGNKLPHLVYTDSNNKKKGKKYFDILVHANAFAVEDAIGDTGVRKNFSNGCADIVVGNPPWGAADDEDKNGIIVLNWCKNKKKEISNNELSQAFLWRAIDLLKDKGTAALLVSSSIILRKSSKSNRVKKNLFQSIRIHEVVNFVHVRHLFFSGAVSPFISIVLKKEIPASDDYIYYRTARRTKVIENTKAVVLDKTDFKFFKYSDTVTDDIWKIYYFGSRRDQSLISGLRLYPLLKEFEVKNLPRRQGFKESIKDRKDAGWLKQYKELPTEAFESKYGPINVESKLKPVPAKVREKGTPGIYEGMRIIIKGGPSQKGYREKGRIIARFHTETFAFRHSVNCIKLESNKEEDYKILLGILWSSLLRYYFLMTSSKWPIWHYQIYLNEIRSLPVAFPENEQLKNRIIKIVDGLRHFKPEALGAEKRIKELEMELDDAIFELYVLTEAECDLIRDRCKYDIQFFYDPSVLPVEVGRAAFGTFQSLPAHRKKQKGLEGYLYIFLKSWNPEVEEGKELSWQIIRHPAVSMIAVVFTLQNKGQKTNPLNSTDEQTEWQKTLRRLEKETRIPYSTTIYIEGIVRVVTKNQIIIIKRNEERLWTRSAAYEDVEATLLQAMEEEKRLNA
jgi:type I restriction-modification system DNA methylase subunit